ncbi:MAG: bifunctional 4-hydroxy-2-oxoglutarate aldolase/2-dehydro-3-deoxy-phosphogluconate aldolase [Syntrophales bacterium]
MNKQYILEHIGKSRVIAVLVIDRVEDAVPLAKALIDGGVNAMELTLRTDAAIDSLRAIIAKVPEMIAGIGTILNVSQVRDVFLAGAAFGVAPGLNRKVIEEARSLGLPFAPGVVTPSDVEKALEYDLRILKFFPAEPSGGLAYLKSMNAPYAHLNLKYIPLGGVNLQNMRSYLEDPMILAVGGSWIADSKLIQKRDWKAITGNAHRASQIAEEITEGR